MKKVFGVAIVLAVVFALMASVSCTKSTPSSPANTATTVPAATATATATTVVAPLYSYAFDTTMDSWSADSGFSAISDASLSTTQVKQGTHSVAVTFTLTGGSQTMFDLKNFGGTVNIAGKTFTAWVWIPAALTADQYALELFVQGSDGTVGGPWNKTDNNWLPGNSSGFTANAWNKITYVLPTDTATQAVQAIGFNMQQNGGANITSPTILYIDDIEVN